MKIHVCLSSCTEHDSFIKSETKHGRVEPCLSRTFVRLLLFCREIMMNVSVGSGWIADSDPDWIVVYATIAFMQPVCGM